MNTPFGRRTAFYAAICFCWSCSTHDFNAAKVVTLKLGHSRSDQYVPEFGEPRSKRVLQTVDGKYETAVYAQAVQNFSGDCVRVLFLEFRNDLFNAYVSGSSCDEDRTTVNITAANALKTGIGTLSADDVLRSLGKPSGKAMCPSKLRDYEERCKKAKTIWYWSSPPERSVVGSGDTSSTSAIVSFDQNDRVLDVETEERFRSAN